MIAMIFFMQAGVVFGQADDSVRTQINESLTNTGVRVDIDTTKSIGTVVGGVIQVALGLLGLIFLILFTYGAFKWMEAQGEEKKVTEARTLMFQAIIGMAIVLGSYALTEFFLGALKDAAGVK